MTVRNQLDVFGEHETMPASDGRDPASPTRVLMFLADASERAHLRRLLEDRGCVVADCSDAAEIERLASEQAFDIAYVDLPKHNHAHLSVMRALRNLPSMRLTPIVAVLDYKALSPLIAAYDSGATGFLLRPIDDAVFLAHHAQVMAQGRQAEKSDDVAPPEALRHARDAFTADACGEAALTTRLIAETAARAFRSGAAEKDPEDRSAQFDQLIKDAFAATQNAPHLAIFAEFPQLGDKPSVGAVDILVQPQTHEAKIVREGEHVVDALSHLARFSLRPAIRHSKHETGLHLHRDTRVAFPLDHRPGLASEAPAADFWWILKSA